MVYPGKHIVSPPHEMQSFERRGEGAEGFRSIMPLTPRLLELLSFYSLTRWAIGTPLIYHLSFLPHANRRDFPSSSMCVHSLLHFKYLVKVRLPRASPPSNKLNKSPGRRDRGKYKVQMTDIICKSKKFYFVVEKKKKEGGQGYAGMLRVTTSTSS